MRRSDGRAARVQHFVDHCRAHGLALTVQRRVIFDALVDRQDHPTADQIYAVVRNRLPGVSRTTVYRVLETLVQAGVIAKACHPGTAARYDPLTHRHHHLVCLHCDKLVDWHDARLDALPLPRGATAAGFEIDDYSVHFRGTCAACRARLGRQRRSTGTRAGRRESEATTRPRRAPASKRRKPR